MRVYFDRRGRARGYTARPLEAYGFLWLWWPLLPITAIIYYLPRGVWRSRLDPIAKVLIIGGVWGVLIAVGEIAAHNTATQASAAGCIDVTTAPSWYIEPNSGAAEAKCTSLTGLYVPRQGCTGTDSSDPANGTSGCSFGEKPRMVGGGPPPRPTPLPTLSLGAQTAACQGHRGPETGPAFPPPLYIGPDSFAPPQRPYFIVGCMDGTSQSAPASAT